MSSRFGFSGLQSSLSGNASKGADSNNELENLKKKLVSARVLNVILDENSKNFDNLGGWTAIGTIEFEMVDYQTPLGETQGFAAPMFSNVKQYPLVNEIVYLIKQPKQDIGVYSDSDKYYYLPPLSIWNHPHHNANPNQVKTSQAPESQKKTTSQISAGATSKSGNSEEELDFNGDSAGTFEERPNIHPLLPFTGDVLYEGRYGNSIRLGNTSKTNSKYANLWSSDGSNGDPITIIRNGQSDDASDKGWEPTTEDVNKDKASLYLTSTQKIPVETVENYQAFSEPPESPAEYVSNQAILNSGRLVLNANVESVIISGQKSISLSANDNIGIQSDGDIVLTGGAVRIGDKEADHPVILGDDFLDQFANLVKAVNGVAGVLTKAQIFPGGSAAPWLPMVGKAAQLKGVTDTMMSILGGDPTKPGSDVKKSKLLSKVTNTA